MLGSKTLRGSLRSQRITTWFRDPHTNCMDETKEVHLKNEHVTLSKFTFKTHPTSTEVAAIAESSINTDAVDAGKDK